MKPCRFKKRELICCWMSTRGRPTTYGDAQHARRDPPLQFACRAGEHALKRDIMNFITLTRSIFRDVRDTLGQKAAQKAAAHQQILLLAVEFKVSLRSWASSLGTRCCVLCAVCCVLCVVRIVSVMCAVFLCWNLHCSFECSRLPALTKNCAASCTAAPHVFQSLPSSAVSNETEQGSQTFDTRCAPDVPQETVFLDFQLCATPR